MSVMTEKYEVEALRIRELCEERGWSAELLSKYVGVSFFTVRNLYFGITADTTLSNAIALARALGTYVENLVVPRPEETFLAKTKIADVVLPPPRQPTQRLLPIRFKKIQIKERFEELGIRQQEVANRSGVKTATISAIIHLNRDPVLSTIIPVAFVLGKHCEELVVEELDL